MKISIITVCFNSAITIEDTIRSVISQNYRDIEYIIVDGGSTDQTLSIIDKYKENICQLISEPDEGLYDAMNKGIKLATGDVIGILNSDDVFQDDDVIFNVIAGISNADIDACYGDLVYVSKDDLSRVVRFWKSCEYDESLWGKGWMPAHPTFFAKSYVYKKYGLFDTSNRLAADYDFLIRVIGKNKIKVKYISGVLVRMRLGGETNKSVGNIVKQNYEIIKAARKNGFYFSLFFFVMKKIRIKFYEFRKSEL
ncbi:MULTISPECIES: glycosyltransferase family 2 protein [unclassified Endozoicomonas]|uniref:glycosyltransferase family 2 protein n=1 Tax=unclassified Endozoicomonas TaxID=2644528 RepID=UPI002148BE37|nr:MULTISPECIES: glycosyltransferase family 2 protein [unclassified Endozoicomonas]